MPTLNNKLSVLFCKRLRLGQLSQLQTLGLPKLNALLNLEHGLPTAMPNVDMDRAMFVAVEEELVPIFLEDLRHGQSLPNEHDRDEPFVVERPELRHAGLMTFSAIAELETPSRVACSDLLNEAAPRRGGLGRGRDPAVTPLRSIFISTRSRQLQAGGGTTSACARRSAKSQPQSYVPCIKKSLALRNPESLRRRPASPPPPAPLAKELRLPDRHRQSPPDPPARWPTALALSPQHHPPVDARRSGTFRVPPPVPPTRPARRLPSRPPLRLVAPGRPTRLQPCPRLASPATRAHRGAASHLARPR